MFSATSWQALKASVQAELGKLSGSIGVDDAQTKLAVLAVSAVASAKTAAAKLKSEWDSQQEQFVKEKQRLATHGLLNEDELNEKKAATSLLWARSSNVTDVKRQIMQLSSDQRNFTTSPPDDTEFSFVMDKYYIQALAILAQDPQLEQMRFKLVPKIITEETFWHNYFYRVSLITGLAQLEDSTQLSQHSPNVATLDSENPQLTTVKNPSECPLPPSPNETIFSAEDQTNAIEEVDALERQLQLQIDELHLNGEQSTSNDNSPENDDDAWEESMNALLERIDEQIKS